MASVVLVHGLWVSDWAMRPLRRRLAAHGLRTHLFRYPSVRRPLDENARALAAFCRQQVRAAPHLVAHSLGGLVVLRMLALEPALECGRIVLLGTPLGGSAAARGFQRLPLGTALIGRSLPVSAPSWIPAEARVGMIAGTAQRGFGCWVGRLEAPHDGTVSVAETRHPVVAEHLCLPVGHMDMLLSAAVASAACRFLDTGHFGLPESSP